VPDHSSFIAVIDDEENMCLALTRLIDVAGYAVRSYFSAESFLEDVDHLHASFIVADIQLRGMSGFDLQRALHRENRGVPFAFITAHDEVQTRADAKASGCVAYLRKPFPGSALLDAIKGIADKDC
jgi:FixJ family two-component response regulator